MYVRRLLSRMRKSGPIAIATLAALSSAWGCWTRLSMPEVNDAGGWFDGLVKVFAPVWTTLCIFIVTIAVRAWISS